VHYTTRIEIEQNFNQDMIVMKKFIISALIPLAIISCEDDNQKEYRPNIQIYDTVTIGDYFPVYPNSYWIYTGSDGDTIIHKTDTGYFLWSNYNPINNPYDTVKYYVTTYDGKAVKKYNIYVGTDSYHESGWETILPDSIYIGNLFQKRYDWPNTYYSGKIQTIDTTLIFNSLHYDSVLIVLEYCGPSVGILPFGKTYFAKNIGIIKTERCSYQSFDSIVSEEFLINYHIEK
jgi:hypothetical protein